MPFNQNINYIQLVGLLVWLASLFKIGIPPNIQQDMLLGIPPIIAVVTWFVHTFVNHPANVVALRQSLHANGITVEKAARIVPAFAMLLMLPVLGACASQATADTSAPSDQLAQLAAFTVADLQAADTDAVNNGDDIAHACYPVLEAFIQNLPNSNSLTTVKGAFSVFQKARDMRNAANAGVPKELIMGCGPLYAQVHGDILKFLANAGIAASPIPLIQFP